MSLFSILLIVLLGLCAAAAGSAEAQATRPADPSLLRDIAIVRERVFAASFSKNIRVDPAAVRRLVETLGDDGTWSDIDYADQTPSKWKPVQHLARLITLTQALELPHSPLHGDPAVLAAQRRALDGWFRLDPRCNNWFWNEIGVPEHLSRVAKLAWDDLDPDRRGVLLDRLARAPLNNTGANLVWLGNVNLVRALLAEDAEHVARTIRRMTDEVRVVAVNGIQSDRSYLFHGPLLYSHGYGAGFIRDMAELSARVAGTRFAIPKERLDLIVSTLLDGNRWMVRYDATDFGAEGRELGRPGDGGRYLVGAARDLLKVPTGREGELEALARSASGDKTAPLVTGNRVFWRADYMAHHRDGFFISARGYSRRTLNTEFGNGECELNHHVADGATAIFRTGEEYRDIYPVWDWQFIPGTTVVLTETPDGPIRRATEKTFVGGVSDGRVGAFAMDFVRDALAARKAWFAFDDMVVALGAGITADTGRLVVTTINQCNLVGPAVASGEAVLSENGDDEQVFTKGSLAHHDEIAYVMLAPAELHVRGAEQVGNWHRINKAESRDEIRTQVFRAWINHGPNPVDASYAYAIVPGVSLQEGGRLATRPGVAVVSNTPSLQAASHERTGAGAAVLYEPGEVTLGGLVLRADQPCLLLVSRDDAGRTMLHASDPTQLLESLSLAVNGKPVEVTLPRGLDAGRSVKVSLD
jgi:chondroitin AC lyase